ncbi:lipoprotein N-acyltransferase Lnb domain-containing protein [Myroides injenensis]|uniref:lipoprotein N-acyltransferase Lnb domain-containing protein n=1 Tax=Myroides injenensis TaxID=1183151 RepID=UPI000289E889|nr:DUF4105 domain-containing protein [Myroides injenensis]
MKAFLYSLLLLFFTQQVLAQDKELSDLAQISVLTVGTGPELHELFGHTAIRVNDPMQGIDRVYNFGMFAFSTPNFALRFVKGDMKYFVVYTPMRNFVMSYVYDNRSVYEQVLNLTSAQKEDIWHKLNEALKEENKYYVYKFIDQNCTTKVVDIVNSATNTIVNAEVPANNKSYRSIFNDYLTDSYFLKLGINMILGARIDEVNDKQFLPDKYMQGLEKTVVDGHPIVSETVTLFSADPNLTSKASWWDSLWFFSLLCVIIGFLGKNYRIIRKVYFFILGSLGVLFAFVTLYSDHIEILRNNIILLCSPLFLVFMFLSNGSKIYKILYIISLIGLGLYIVLNVFSERLLITLPLFLLTLFFLIIDKRQNKLII